MEKEIEGVFASYDTKTYREAADEIGVARSTLHRFATEKFDFRCLNQKVRPFPTEAQRAKRVDQI